MAISPSADTVEQAAPEAKIIDEAQEKAGVKFNEDFIATEVIVELQERSQRNGLREYVRDVGDLFSKWKILELGASMVKLGKFIGPSAMISVAYIDPDNYQTAISSGAGFQYKLLFMILISNLIAIYLQVSPSHSEF